MPSVSKKQHNLMEAVAHNPGFAKKVGIPQKVGEHFHKADKMKRRKHYDEGGDVDPDVTHTEAAASDDKSSDDTSSGQAPARKMSPSEFGLSSFGRAFREARNAGDKTFQWKGKTYNTDMAPRKATLLPNEGRFSMLKGKAPTLDAYNKITGTKYAKGGHVKPNELHGKAKETKSIAKEEMKALKRGHAPKAIMEHERAEHKAMGYKHGGKVETPHKGFAMGKGMGHGRKAPHSTKGEEGDTKLKGFGMAKGTGKGRSVTRAKAPKEETKQKGFAMKKGGHVKHHAKGGAAKAPPKPKKSKVDPAALAAMMGPPPGAAPGPMGAGPGGMPGVGGAPGMKKGGHVAHHAHHGHGHQIHHHHHYAKGGSVRAGIDEKAQRGHTRGKQVKMASGGHVGSHPSRRGDGMAHKGHTRCKIV